MSNRYYSCRYCGQLGHNKRTCLVYKQKVLSSSIDSPIVRRYTEMKERGKDRQCIYCKGCGHNRTTCLILKSDKLHQMIENQKYRKEIWKLFQEYGFGLGTLLAFNNSNKPFFFNHNDKPFFIDKIDWDLIGPNRKGSLKTFRAVHCKDFSQNEWKSHFLSSSLEEIKKIFCNIIVPCPHEMLGVGMPTNWLVGVSGIENWFEF